MIVREMGKWFGIAGRSEHQNEAAKRGQRSTNSFDQKNAPRGERSPINSRKRQPEQVSGNFSVLNRRTKREDGDKMGTLE